MTEVVAEITKARSLYEQDILLWVEDTVTKLKAGDFQNLDIVNLIEEVESLGKQQKQELRNRLGTLIGHLLKWDYQPELRSKSWKATIREQRDEVYEILHDNPSLKPYLNEAIQKGFRKGINLVIKETPLDLPDLPQVIPYTIAQILDLDFPTGINH
ncbi:MAG: DUF29 domain-containing protein [Pseudanabaena sp. ELA607]|jgi:hypothetical protein